ncbi:MAG: hypothetical protein HY060_16040, partial [Proteobacteria bacterium]|nr:hypothetical protein [Pseudomonadota bacterium]
MLDRRLRPRQEPAPALAILLQDAILPGSMDTGIEGSDRADWRLSLAGLVGPRAAAALAPPVALAGGTLHRHWRIDLPIDGRIERFVLRRTASRVLDSLPRPVECAVQRAAFEAGVPVPEPLACGAD